MGEGAIRSQTTQKNKEILGKKPNITIITIVTITPSSEQCLHHYNVSFAY